MKAFEFDQHLITAYERFSHSFTKNRSTDLQLLLAAHYEALRDRVDTSLLLSRVLDILGAAKAATTFTVDQWQESKSSLKVASLSGEFEEMKV